MSCKYLRDDKSCEKCKTAICLRQEECALFEESEESLKEKYSAAQEIIADLEQKNAYLTSVVDELRRKIDEARFDEESTKTKARLFDVIVRNL